MDAIVVSSANLRSYKGNSLSLIQHSSPTYLDMLLEIKKKSVFDVREGRGAEEKPIYIQALMHCSVRTFKNRGSSKILTIMAPPPLATAGI